MRVCSHTHTRNKLTKPFYIETKHTAYIRIYTIRALTETAEASAGRRRCRRGLHSTRAALAPRALRRLHLELIYMLHRYAGAEVWNQRKTLSASIAACKLNAVQTAHDPFVLMLLCRHQKVQ